MKKFLIVSAVILCATNVSIAQSRVGARAGLNISSVHGDDVGSNAFDPLVGFHFGLYGSSAFNDLLGVQGELNYSIKGYELDFFGETKAIYSYLDIPLLLRIKPIEGLALYAGPQPAILLSAKAKSDGETTEIEDTKFFELSGVFGVSYELESGLNFSTRYALGLTTTDDSAFDFDIKNGVFQFGIGYSFIKN